jgi:hypothetical protein
MGLENISDAEILISLDNISKEKNIELKLAHKLFFLSLWHYCQEKGALDMNSNQYYVQLSVGSFTNMFRVGSTTVVQALKLLTLCGVIRRTEQPRDFRKLPSGAYKKNSAYRTYIIDKLIIEKRNA